MENISVRRAIEAKWPYMKTLHLAYHYATETEPDEKYVMATGDPYNKWVLKALWIYTKEPGNEEKHIDDVFIDWLWNEVLAGRIKE